MIKDKKYKVTFLERVGSNEFIKRYEYTMASSAIKAKNNVLSLFSCRMIRVLYCEEML